MIRQATSSVQIVFWWVIRLAGARATSTPWEARYARAGWLRPASRAESRQHLDPDPAGGVGGEDLLGRRVDQLVHRHGQSVRWRPA